MRKSISKGINFSFDIKGFDTRFFQKKKFTAKTIQKYLNNALKSFQIAKKYKDPEIIFKFSYDALIKIGICILASLNLRVKSRSGHHVKILEMLSRILNDEEILILGDAMRKKRNLDLYGEGIFISQKEARDYLNFLTKVFKKAREYLKKQKSLFE